MSAELLTPLQWRVLRGVAAAVPQLFLSGGAALAGFHLKHRPTTDLDFFTTDNGALKVALRALSDVAASIGATSTTATMLWSSTSSMSGSWSNVGCGSKTPSPTRT